MKSRFALCWLVMSGVVVWQACGSEDGSKKSPGSGYSAGGDGAAGEPATSTSGNGGNGGSGGSVSDAGAPGSADGGMAGATPTGSAGEGGESSLGGAGGAGGTGEAGEAGASSMAGAGGAGETVTCEVAPTCTGDLSSVGTGDFSISFTLTTAATVRSGVISQRAICMHSKFWDVRMGPTGNVMQLSVEVDDASKYTSFSAPAPTINDGTPHEVRVCRKAGQVYVFADGALIGSKANESNLSALAALATKTTHCMPYDGTTTLVGTVEDVCVGAL